MRYDRVASVSPSRRLELQRASRENNATSMNATSNEGAGVARANEARDPGGTPRSDNHNPLEERLGGKFQCAISFDTLVKPVTLTCGHNFSLDNICAWVKKKGSAAFCPSCKAKIGKGQIANLRKDKPDYNREFEDAIQQLQKLEANEEADCDSAAVKKRRVTTADSSDTLFCDGNLLKQLFIPPSLLNKVKTSAGEPSGSGERPKGPTFPSFLF